ncbi:protein FAR-RED IMPAIRED RESPONSE 1-like [Chenopodium quinoa]|uniref:protein FAR-RED IMPAIRED RESPONSE 1-like n=1 Tax=Chenopodium quinoa TaxID=63459 RepID=UPI000B790E12|nr:protein FAR-RED IMPAIRED RESPONSE 1-like [Chenopodium quinoa]
MVFKRWQDVEMYFKEYAQQHDFGVCRQAGSFSKQKERRAVTSRCDCWGHPDMRARWQAKKRAKAMEISGTVATSNGDIGENELSCCKRTSKKCQCLARIYASVNCDGEWVLKTVELNHVHKLDPSGSKLVKEYRMKNHTSTVKKKLMDFYEEGVPVTQIHGCMAAERGGDDDDLPSVKDLQHEVSKERRLKMEGGDAVAMMSYFDRMQADNQKFFHAHRLDKEGRLKDVLWVDARSRVAYQEFGDVVCFDATYLTNEYELPFANFVGVNHHGQSILLGCALASHETTETYFWVFEQWLSCMGGIAPSVILTDQVATMRKPIAHLMPSSRHRWCIWHIIRKIPKNLGKCKQ